MNDEITQENEEVLDEPILEEQLSEVEPDIEDISEEVASEETPESVEKDPYFEKAYARGWRPLEEYKDNPEDWVDAREYMLRQPFVDKINKLREEKELLAKSFEEFRKELFSDKVSELNSLKAEIQQTRARAVEEGDTELFNAAEEKLQEINSRIQNISSKVPEEKQNQGVDPQEFAQAQAAFLERNKVWFNVDQELTKMAHEIDQELLQKYPNESPLQRLDRLETTLQLAFRDRVSKKGSQAPSQEVTQPKTPVSKGPKPLSYNTLNDIQKNTYQVLKQQKAEMGVEYTIKDFVATLKKMGEI